MSYHPVDLQLPEGVQWYDLCKHHQALVLQMMQDSRAHPFAFGNTGRLPDLKCKECKNHVA